MKDVWLIFLGMTGFIFFFSPIFAVYKYSGHTSLFIIPLTQWAVSSVLWKQKFSQRKSILLWSLLSFLLIAFCFIRDRLMTYFGFELYYHSIISYIYIGIPTTIFWWVYRVLSLTQKNRFADWINRH